MHTENPFGRMNRGTPPWDIGRPQKALVELERSGKVRGKVLEVGCGTGENALLLASKGRAALGIDGAARAIELARKKAHERGIHCRFEVNDALELEALNETFDSVVDSGLFHVFGDSSREAYRDSLISVLRPGSTLHILCFSEHEPDWGGPRRVTQAEIRGVFAAPFFVESIEAQRYETLIRSEGARAWLASITYVGARSGTLS